MTEPSVVELRDVRVAYGGFKAVDGVSLAVARGERVAVIGPNGAGKTTLFKAISGEVSLSSGEVLLRGRDIARLPPFRRARLGVGRTYQITDLFPRLTVAESITVSLMATHSHRWRSWRPLKPGAELRDRVEAVARMVRLESRLDAITAEMSHGEQRQLEIAVAVANEPTLLLLDEPAAGLTVAEREHFQQLIDELPRQMSVMLIEHDMEIALGLVDRVLCMADGRPVAMGTPEQVRSSDEVRSVYLRGIEC